MTTLFEAFVASVAAEGLADSNMSKNYMPVYLPLAQWLFQCHEQTGQRLIGINGAQGSGKSTLARILALLLQHGFDKSVVVLSLDDFYLTRVQRDELAKRVHPLLQTRGVPGTHDVTLALAVLTALKNAEPVMLPQFDKSLDDRVASSCWKTLELPVDIILFEGWCVGALPQNNKQLQPPVNELEAQEDAQGVWRQFVNTQLATDYQTLFALLDTLLMLKVPSFDCVYAWRALQEIRLQQGMSQQQLRRFILHYERLTKHMLNEMPQRADKVLHVGEDHQIIV